MVWPLAIIAFGRVRLQKSLNCGRGGTKTRINRIFSPVSPFQQLAGARFPLGEIEKPRVREIARELNLPVADKKDSQGICFLGKVKVPEFLSHFIDDKPGEIITTAARSWGGIKAFIDIPWDKEGELECLRTPITKISW